MGNVKFSIKEFQIGVFFNFVSLLIIGLLGFSINALIARYYGDTGLGIFSQVFAFFIIAGQLAAGGFVFAAMRFCAEHANDRDKVSGIVWSGLILVGAQGGWYHFLYGSPANRSGGCGATPKLVSAWLGLRGDSCSSDFRNTCCIRSMASG